MRIAVIGIRDAWSTTSLANHLEKKGMGGDIIELSDIAYDLNHGESYCSHGLLTQYDGIIIKKMGKFYSPELIDHLDMFENLERKGVKFFSSPSAIKKMISRLSCTLRLRESGIPMPPTLITENVDEALEWLSRHEKAVLKPHFSTKARGMKIISTGLKAKEEIEDFQNNYQKIIYMQQVVDLSGEDYGFVFLGGEYKGAYSRVGSGGSWNTTTVNGGKYRSFDPSNELIDLAYKAQDIFGLDFTSVDVAITKNGPIIFEVSAFGGYRGLYESSGVDASDLLTDYVIEKISS